MSVDLKKQIVDLRKKAAVAVEKRGLAGQRAQVVLVLDISRSMNRLYKDGIVQQAIERLLGLALNFDDDGQIDLYLFGTRAYALPPVTLEDIEGYVQDKILAHYRINEATYYAPPLRLIGEKYQGQGPDADPVFVIFLTDGGNADRRESAEVVRALSSEPIFLQFVGIGPEDFPFLKRLDELEGRLVDNAGFFHLNDLATVADDELYDRLLVEFPDWLAKAKAKRILS